MGRFGRGMMVWAMTLLVFLSAGSRTRGDNLRSDVQTLVASLHSYDGSSPQADRVYRTRTTVLPNGRILRHVFQATDRTPKEVQDRKVWADLSYPKEEIPEPVRHSYLFGSRPLFGGQPANPGKAPPGGFFAASGSFLSADRLPQHIRFPSGDGRPDRKLAQECQSMDYVFVTEYTWRETLPEVNNGKADAAGKRAREELVDRIINHAERFFDRRVNRRCDASELIRWLRKAGKPELCGLLEELNEENVDALVSRLTRWGLDPQKGLSAQAGERLLTALCRRVQGADGKPVAQKTMDQWLGQALSIPDGMTAEEAILLCKKAAEALPRVSALQTLTGDHAAASLFDFQATLPGVVVQTNGSAPPPPPAGGMVGVGSSSRLNVIPGDWRSSTTLGEATIRWQFYRGAIPQGFSMVVRTLASDEDLQWKLFKKYPLADRDRATAYIKLARSSEPLLTVLRHCRKDESLQPLLDYRRRLAATNRDEKDRVQRLLALLANTPKP